MNREGRMGNRSSVVVVRTVDVAVPDLAPGLRGLRIAHISDLHFRRWNRATSEAQQHLLSLDYDILAATGDFGTLRRHWRRSADVAKRFFEPLAERQTVYAVLGNHDDVRLGSADLPVRFLDNEAVMLEHCGAGIELLGVNQATLAAEDLEGTLADRQTQDTSILLAHYPSTVYRLPEGRVDLQLSGHTHGGQIRVPWLGCLWPNDTIPRHMARGLHTVAGTQLHVSSGIGVSPPVLMRFNCPAEVTVLTLQPVESAQQEGSPERSAVLALAGK